MRLRTLVADGSGAEDAFQARARKQDNTGGNTMMKKTAVLLAAACVMLAASSAGADVIVRYGFLDDPGTHDWDAPDAGYPIANVAATNVASNNWNGDSGRGDTSSTPYDDGNTDSIYWYAKTDGEAFFTLDAADTYAVNYTSISFKIDAQTAAANDEWYVSTDLTGELGSDEIITSVDGNGEWTLAQLDLSGVSALQGVDEVIFTVGFRDVATSVDSVRIDKIQVEGTVVPEPATMSLLAIGGLGALLRRKRS
jgi:hypothetical protein